MANKASAQTFRNQPHVSVFPDGRLRRGRADGVTTHPYVVLVDHKGRVRCVHEGFLQGEEKQLEAAIRAVLAGRPVPKEKG